MSNLEKALIGEVSGGKWLVVDIKLVETMKHIIPILKNLGQVKLVQIP